ncbi:D-lactaldehyde dehydrogenase [Amanita muscaria]
MPVITSGAKVLVTGADGFISIWLIRTLLEQGYVVRGTVHSLERSSFLVDMFKSHDDKFELVAVEDITRSDDAFDESVKGVDAIIHAVSPVIVTFDVDDPNELIEPAVNGTVGILRSAVKNGPGVRRVVVLASTGSIYRESNELVVLNEKDWNDSGVIERVEQLGRSASSLDKYRAATTLAEKAAWAFYHERQSQLNWDLVVIHAPFAFGPPLAPVSTPAELNLSIKVWYYCVVDPQTSEKRLLESNKSWVDVRDLVLATAKSLVVPEAGGERMIISAGSNVWQDWIDVANSLSPSPIPSHAPGTNKALPKGRPEGKHVKHTVQYDASKAQRILAPQYRSMDETVRDMLADFERRRW